MLLLKALSDSLGTRVDNPALSEEDVGLLGGKPLKLHMVEFCVMGREGKAAVLGLKDRVTRLAAGSKALTS